MPHAGRSSGHARSKDRGAPAAPARLARALETWRPTTAPAEVQVQRVKEPRRPPRPAPFRHTPRSPTRLFYTAFRAFLESPCLRIVYSVLHKRISLVYCNAFTVVLDVLRILAFDVCGDFR